MDLRDATVAVTGATGFLGRYLCHVLLGRGARVVGVVRNPARVPALAAAGVEMRRADLADRGALTGGFAGADAVISNAALVSVRAMISPSRRLREAQRRVNVEGTRHVMEAAAGAGVPRIVHVSSVTVYARHRGRPAHEDLPLRGAASGLPLGGYGLSKALAEREAWNLARRLGLALTTVRPGGMYGAFDTSFLPIFRWLICRPVTVVPVFTRIPFAYGGDVAEAIVRALERPATIGRAYNVAGPDVSVLDLVRAWRAAGGRAPRVMIPLPVPVRQRIDTTRAARELGWLGRPMVETLRETIAWEGEAGR